MHLTSLGVFYRRQAQVRIFHCGSICSKVSSFLSVVLELFTKLSPCNRLMFLLDFNINANLAHEVGKNVSDFVMPHEGVTNLCTVKGVGKVKKLTTCSCEWNVGWFQSISNINSIPEFGFLRLKLYLLSGSAFNQFGVFFGGKLKCVFFTMAQVVQILVLFWFVLSVLSVLIFL